MSLFDHLVGPSALAVLRFRINLSLHIGTNADLQHLWKNCGCHQVPKPVQSHSCNLIGRELLCFGTKIAHINAPFRNAKCLGDSGGVVRVVLIAVLALLFKDSTILLVLAALLTLHAGLLASQVFPGNFLNQNGINF
jgi:hypothetical protein